MARNIDPRRDPTDPPKKALGVTLPKVPKAPPPPVIHDAPGTSQRPSVRPGSHWTPAGVSMVIAAIVTALGGAGGVSQLMGSDERTRDAIADAKQEILDECGKNLEQMNLRLDQVDKDNTVRDSKIRLVTDLANQINGGPAGPGWPYKQVSWEPLPVTGTRIPTHKNYVSWPSK